MRSLFYDISPSQALLQECISLGVPGCQNANAPKTNDVFKEAKEAHSSEPRWTIGCQARARKTVTRTD
jgi:hypothetical protein